MWTRRAILSIFVLGAVCLLSPDAVKAEVRDNYGDACNATANITCNSGLFLICSTDTNRCGCIVGMHLDPHRVPQTCVSKVEQVCWENPSNGLPAKYCTPNALCLPDGTNTTTKRCYCQRNFVVDADGACIQSSLHGETCTIDQQCKQNGFLRCGDQNTCVCDINEATQEWDPVRQICVSLIGGSCQGLSPGVPRTCIDKSTCQEDVCRCDETNSFVPSLDKRRCVRPFNGTCTTNGDCADGLLCNFPPTPAPTTTTTVIPPTTAEPATTPAPTGVPTIAPTIAPTTATTTVGPAVDQGTCGCDSTERYDSVLQQCHILANRNCSANSAKQCVENSQCLNSICQCNDKYIPTAEGTCAGNFGASCNSTPTDTCSTINFLRCNNGTTCVCNQNYELNQVTGKCMAYIGGTCIDNNNCDSITSECRASKCECKTSFVLPGDGTPISGIRCLGGHGASCATAKCDDTRFLNCSPENQCTCLNVLDQTFDDSLGKCIAFADGVCKLSDGREMGCVANATCDASTENGLCKCNEDFHVEEKQCKENSANIFHSLWLPIISVTGLVFKMQF